MSEGRGGFVLMAKYDIHHTKYLPEDVYRMPDGRKGTWKPGPGRMEKRPTEDRKKAHGRLKRGPREVEKGGARERKKAHGRLKRGAGWTAKRDGRGGERRWEGNEKRMRKSG
jgi:hypothetical protein